MAAAACGGDAAARDTRPPAAHAAALADTIRVDGSAGVLPLVQALAREFGARDPDVVILAASGLGARARIEALAERRIDVAMASHGVDVPSLARQGLAAHEIARVAVVFAVNQSVGAISLTRGQLCDLYAARTTNWRDLGGPDLPVVLLTRPEGEVDADVVAAGVDCFRDALPGGSARVLEQPDQMAEALATTAGAIGMTSMPFVDGSEGRLRAVVLDGVAPTAANVTGGRHTLTRQSFLLTRSEPPPAVQRFLDFVRSADGERVIRGSAAVPVR